MERNLFSSQWCDGYIPSDLPSVLLQSDAATGKTKWIVGLIQSKPSASVLLVVPTRTHASMLIDELPNSRILILTLESLLHLTDPQFAFDIIVLDDITCTLRHFHSSTLDGIRLPTFAQLALLVRRAKQVIGVDADVSERAVWFMETAGRRKSYKVYENQHRPYNAWTVELHHQNMEYVMRAVIKAVQEDRRIVVVCNSKTWAKEMRDRIRNECPGKVGVLYTSDEDNKTATECNRVWAYADFVIYSPVITTGLSYSNAARPFDQVFCLLKDTSNAAQDVVRQIGRIRPCALANKTIVANLESERRHLPTTLAEIKQADDTLARLGPYAHLHVLNTLEANRGSNNYGQELQTSLEAAGIKVVHRTTNETRAGDLYDPRTKKVQ